MDEKEFKIGDKVELISEKGGFTEGIELDIGHVGRITEITEAGAYRIDAGMCSFAAGSDLKLVKEGTKETKPTYLVVWDTNSEDPHKVCYSEKEAKDKVKELYDSISVVKHSIVIYKIAEIIKPTATITFKKVK